VPCIVGKDGVEKIIELDLDPETRAEFLKSAAVAKETIEKMKNFFNN
jgi:malate/lactate dehydrogenase